MAASKTKAGSLGVSPGPASQSDSPAAVVARFVEKGMRRLVEHARRGDRRAARRLHEFLADALRRDALTEYERSILIEMHEALARGEDAEAAMLVAAPPNRPVERRRDEELWSFIDGSIHGAAIRRQKPDMAELFRRAGKAFGVSAGRAKAIYLQVRREVEPGQEHTPEED